jgi:pimeloyl-ACP methyl ester carboxylesterase
MALSIWNKRVCAGILLAATALCGGCRERDEAPVQTAIPMTSCTIQGYPHPVECGVLQVAADRSATNSGTIGLRVVRIASRGLERQPTPLFMLAGGPGQAATEAYPAVLPILADAIRDRDVVLVDQRGTGQSAALDCAVDESLDQAFDRDGLAKTARRCAKELADRGDLSMFRTASSADDIDAVRDALGYERIDVLGGSYGTRLALAYAERHPTRVRSLVLDGMAPRGLAIPLPMAADAERAIGLMTERCKGLPACAKSFPDIAGDLRAVMARLEEDPEVTVNHPRTGERITIAIPPESFIQSLRGLLYAPELVMLLPLALAEAKKNNFDPFVAQANYLGDGQLDAMSLGLFLTIVCSEDMPRIDDAETAAQTKDTVIGDTMVTAFRRACAAWPAGPAVPGLDVPESVSAPILALSGELDPVTPPRWAEHVLSHAKGPHRHVVIPGCGHGTMIRSCVPELIDRFLDAPEQVGDLDDGCVVDIFGSFFVDFAGPPH